mgnify:CR=1 FL=1
MKVYIWNLKHIYGIIIYDHYPSRITIAWILTELWPFSYLENSWLKFCVQHPSSKLLNVSIWNLIHIYGIIIYDNYPSPITIAWILNELLPFLYLEIFRLKFCMQHPSSKLLKVFIWNFIHIYRIIIYDHCPSPITLGWILTELWPFFYLENSWLKFCVQHPSSKHLKLKTHLRDHNLWSLSKSHNSSMDFKWIIALFVLRKF